MSDASYPNDDFPIDHRDRVWGRLLPAGLPTSCRAAREFRPFSWQHGSSVWVLDASPLSWVLAELRFDTAACGYVEVRRVHYRWQREAVGALLGRAIAVGDHEAETIARQLSAWLMDA